MAKLAATTALAVDSREELGRRLEVGIAQTRGPDDGVDAVSGVGGRLARTASATLKSTTTSVPLCDEDGHVAPDREPLDDLALMERIDGGDQLEVGCRRHRQTDLTAHPAAGSDHTDLAHWLNPNRPANDATWSAKASSSKGPTALRVRGASTSSCAWASTSSRPTASMRASTSSIVWHLAVQEHGGTDAAHAGAGVLAREQHLRPQVALGHGQLPVGDPVGGQQLELTGHDAQHLVDVIGRRADDDGERAGILVGGPLRPDRVGQPALFAHLLEEPARQAAPQARD